jgi:two-component system, LytTR family, sensor kinase
MSKKKRNILAHSLAWILFLLYEWLFKQGVFNNPDTAIFHLKIVVIRVAVLLPAVYFTLYYLVPQLFLRGKRLQFLLSLLGTIMLTTLVMKTFNHFLVLRGLEGFAPTFLKAISGLNGWLIFMGNIAFNISFALMIYFINKWVKDDKKLQELKAANKEAELSLLKSQVHPHFIFNTLNNIYALSKKGASNTSEMIYRLSGLLEYMLYDSNKEWISLEKEISYIKNYIEIEKIRYGNRLDVSFDLYSLSKGLSIPPLVILAFVENSFKHGLSRQTGSCWLKIVIEYSAPYLTIKVENSKSEDITPSPGSGGLGLENVRKRLDILLQENYELKQFDGNDSYLVILKMISKLNMHEPEQAIQNLEMSGS